MAHNITREESATRAGLLDVESYRIALDLREVETSHTFASTSTVRFAVREPGSATWIDLLADEVLSAELNGRALDLSGYDGGRLALVDLAADNELVVRARCRYMTTGEGLHRSVDPTDGQTYLYTQCAAADARRVFACFEQPDLKARFLWDVIAPATWQVVSNRPTPDPLQVEPGLARWVFSPTHPLPTYLAALCAGPFHVVRSEYAGPHGTYPLGLFARASMAEHLDAEEILDITRIGLAHYERQFVVPYPFAKYDQVFVPEFNFGAMENPGVVTFREDAYLYRSRVTEAARETRAMVIGHEMAHMWFGDLVTMRWWDDLWLNESFATWAGYDLAASATRFTGAWTTFALAQKAWAYVQDQLPSTHPVVGDVPELEGLFEQFDGITYAKGASVLTQLVAYIGHDAFVAGVNRYFERHAWGNATLADLLVELEGVSGRDLEAWARVWLREPGVTTLQAHVELDGSGAYARVLVEQLPATRPPGVPQVLRPHRIAIGAYRWTEVEGHRRLVREARVEVDVPGAGAEVPELVGVRAADLLLVNDDDLTYAKVRLDPSSMATALVGVGDLAESLPRAVVWGALWEQVRDLGLPAQDFVGVALTALAHEERPGIIDTVRGLLVTASTRFVAPELRADLRQRMAMATHAMLEAAEPGSDQQLSLARLYFESAGQPAQLSGLRDLLAGRAEIRGLPLEDELRWAAVIRCAAGGAAGPELIDAELAADPTTKGAQFAAQARAAMPDATAKEAAWAAAISGGLSTVALVSTIAGFAHPDTPVELLEPYRQRYSEQIVDLVEDRSPIEGLTLARGLFPPIGTATVAAADALLADADLPAGLRRVVLERRDDVQLALACQEVSRAAG
ncbi:MAG: aminopeptidase N [Candidatus Nanopelagicales bacterium]|jgi:aminopeptidase N|nr:aminopeptidase N [Candidatus Nanopelagicales bacterium]